MFGLGKMCSAEAADRLTFAGPAPLNPAGVDDENGGCIAFGRRFDPPERAGKHATALQMGCIDNSAFLFSNGEWIGLLMGLTL